MKIFIYPKDLLESAWKKDKKSLGFDTTPCCLRCGQPLDKQFAVNARSRYVNAFICRSCGSDEAMRDFNKNPLPLPEWHAVTSGRIKEQMHGKNPVLKASCSFTEIFKDTPKVPGAILAYPVNEVVYSRSDYDGYRWWTTWNNCNQKKPSSEMVQEIDQFHNALFTMKEFQSLDTMRQLCYLAEHTSSSTEYNLYSETEHFYIWLKMITRFRDYNLYVHYYLK